MIQTFSQKYTLGIKTLAQEPTLSLYTHTPYFYLSANAVGQVTYQDFDQNSKNFTPLCEENPGGGFFS